MILPPEIAAYNAAHGLVTVTREGLETKLRERHVLARWVCEMLEQNDELKRLINNEVCGEV